MSTRGIHVDGYQCIDAVLGYTSRDQNLRCLWVVKYDLYTQRKAKYVVPSGSQSGEYASDARLVHTASGDQAASAAIYITAGNYIFQMENVRKNVGECDILLIYDSPLFPVFSGLSGEQFP